MLIQKITWWLWNQMFQYAYIKALSTKNNIDFKLDLSDYKTYFRPFELDLFNLNYEKAENLEIKKYKWYTNNFLWKIKKILINKWIIKRDKKYYIEKQFNFDKDFLEIKEWYIEWYFQTEKYFKNIEKVIRKDFTFPKFDDKKNLKIEEEINKSNSVSIHIRRWDYITNKNANSFHWTCNLEYYNNAIKIIKEKIKNPVFFFLSDDINWVKENFNIKNAYFIDWNTWDNSWKDMKLMSSCKHNIIANSSFSWWGAWLNNNKWKIVITPKKWFNNKKVNTNDIIPNNWIKI